MHKGENVFFDVKYVSGLVKKYKKNNKILKIIIIVLFLLFLLVSSFYFLDKIKKDNYERYLNTRIDYKIDNILKETVKTKFLTDKMINNNINTKDYSSLVLSLNALLNSYSEIKDILFIALENVAPDKIRVFSKSFYDYIKNINLKFNSNNLVLNDDQVNTIKKYDSILNKILFVQRQLISTTDENKENNLNLYDLDFSNIDTIEKSFDEKYNKGLKYTIKNDNWINMLVKLESLIVQNK